MTKVRIFAMEALKASLDLTNLREIGELLIMFPSNKPSPMALNTFLNAIRRCLKENDFNERKDLICMVGPILSVAWLTHTVLEVYGYGRFVMFDSSSSKYVVQEVHSTIQMVENEY